MLTLFIDNIDTNVSYFVDNDDDHQDDDDGNDNDDKGWGWLWSQLTPTFYSMGGSL